MIRALVPLAAIAMMQIPTVSLAATPTIASATLIGANGNPAGEAVFKAAKDGVVMTITATGLSPGPHGLHLHAVGSCQTPDFKSAGGHWNPMNRKHGMESSEGPHMGDLPNLQVDAQGRGYIEALIKMARLDGSAMGLLDADGTAIVVHASPDDNMTDPSGNSGARVVCGVVKAD